MGPMRMGYTPSKKPMDKATPKRVMRTFVPYKLELLLVFAAVLISVTLGLFSPWFLKAIINEGILGKRLDIVQRYTIYTLLATIGGVAFGLGYSYLSIDVGQRIMRDLRNELYSHLQAMSLRFFTGTRTGEIQSRLANDVGGIQSVVSDTFANLLTNVTTVIAALGGMIVMDWRLTILSVGLLPFFAWLAFLVGGWARNLRTKIQAQLADMNSTMNETLSVSGVLLTKTSGRQGLALGKFKEQNEAFTKTMVGMSMVMKVFFNLIGFTFQVTSILVYWLAGYLVSRPGDHLNIGIIVGFTALQSRLLFPLTGLLNVQVELGSAMGLFD